MIESSASLLYDCHYDSPKKTTTAFLNPDSTALSIVLPYDPESIWPGHYTTIESKALSRSQYVFDTMPAPTQSAIVYRIS